MDGTGFEEALFTKRAVQLIHRHAVGSAGAPFFLYYAMHLLHSPLCALPAHLERFASIANEERRYVAAMAWAMDEAVGTVAEALHASGMWPAALFVWTSDNGAAIEQVTGGKSAYPLRGGYYTNWEGAHGGQSHTPSLGAAEPSEAPSDALSQPETSPSACSAPPARVTRRARAAPMRYPTSYRPRAHRNAGGIRAPGLVNGGWLPIAARGRSVSGLMHLADWYATFCGLARVDPTDETAATVGLPPIDSLDMWPMIAAMNETGPRTEILLTPLSGDRYNGTNMRSGDAALIVGRYKLIVGRIAQASWTGPTYPNSTSPWDTWTTVQDCSPARASGGRFAATHKVGCLFDIFADPSEHHDLAMTEPKRAERMLRRLQTLDASVFDPDRGTPDRDGACKQVVANGGYWGPWLGPT